MMRDAPICDWDAGAGLAVLRLPDAPRAAPLLAVIRERVARPGQPLEEARWQRRLARPIAPEESLALLRAPALGRRVGAAAFELLLFPYADRGGAQGETRADAVDLDRPETARHRFVFRSDLIYAPDAPENPGRRTRLRYFWPTGRPGDLAEAAGPSLPEGARPGAVLSRVWEEHRAAGRGPFAASASVSDGRARGPTVRALPDEAAPIEAEFGWFEEQFADAFAAAGRPAPEGFESSRFPMVDIDLTAYGPAAEAASQAIWFLHAPLGPEGYDGDDLRLSLGVLDQIEDRLVLRHAWPDAAHRDLIGVWARLGRPLKTVGMLPIEGRAGAVGPALAAFGRETRAVEPAEDAAAFDGADPLGVDADAVLALYLGELARDAFAVTDLGLAPGAPEIQAQLAEARAEVAARLAQAVEAGGRVSREADRGAARLGLDWAEAAIEGFGRAARDAGPPPEPGAAAAALDGARWAAPETVAAFLELRDLASELEGPSRRAMDALDIDLTAFSRFRDHADAALALAADPTLAAVAAGARQPIRAELPTLALRLADAVFNQDVASWWEGFEKRPDAHGAELGLWRMLRARVDLAAVRQSGLEFDADPPPVEDVDAAVAVARRGPDRTLAAKVVVDLDDPAIQADAEHLAAPRTLAAGAAAARALRAAEAAVRADLTRAAAACKAARAPAPEPFDAIWGGALRMLSGEAGPGDVAAERALGLDGDRSSLTRVAEEDFDRILVRATEVKLSEVAHQVGGAALAERLDGLKTRLVRAEIIGALDDYARDLKILNATYAEIRDAVWCPPEDFAREMVALEALARNQEPEERRLLQAEQRAADTFDGRLLEAARRDREAVDRSQIADEVEALRGVLGRAAAPRAAPVWRTPAVRKRHQAFLRAGQKRLERAETTLSERLEGRTSAGVRAAEADLRAVNAGLPWVAARQVWRFLCAAIEERRRNERGRLRVEAERLAARLSAPPEAWPEIEADLDRLLVRIAERDRIAEDRRNMSVAPVLAPSRGRRSVSELIEQAARRADHDAGAAPGERPAPVPGSRFTDRTRRSREAPPRRDAG